MWLDGSFLLLSHIYLIAKISWYVNSTQKIWACIYS